MKNEVINDEWVEACNTSDIEKEDVIRFDHSDRSYAIYRTKDDKYYATDGLCTHGNVHLSGGLVIDNLIECPKHNGRFNYTTGQPTRSPACVHLKTYPVKVEGNKIFLILFQKNFN